MIEGSDTVGVRCAILFIMWSYRFFKCCWCQAVDGTFWKEVPITNCTWIKAVSVVLSSGLWYVVCEDVFSASWCVVLFRRMWLA